MQLKKHSIQTYLIKPHNRKFYKNTKGKRNMRSLGSRKYIRQICKQVFLYCFSVPINLIRDTLRSRSTVFHVIFDSKILHKKKGRDYTTFLEDCSLYFKTNSKNKTLAILFVKTGMLYNHWNWSSSQSSILGRHRILLPFIQNIRK